MAHFVKKAEVGTPEEDAVEDLEQALEELIEEEETELELKARGHGEVPEILEKESQEIDSLFMCVPMKTKPGPEVLEAIQEITIRLEREGLIVKRLHTERGKNL